jgi:hypothetical protein
MKTNMADKLPLTQRQLAKTGRAVCSNCGQFSWINSQYPKGKPVLALFCDSCDRKVWADDRDGSQFDSAAEHAQGVA